MTRKLVIDTETGTQSYIDLTPEEEEAQAGTEAAVLAQAEREGRVLAFVDGLRPDATLITKIRNGTAPTNSELVRLVYWLVARELAGGMVD